MKRILFTNLILSIFFIAYGQDDKIHKETIEYEAKTIVLSTTGNQLKLKEDVTIKIINKLNIKSDSAFYDREKRYLIAYGMKKFTFEGKITVKGKKKIAQYYLDSDLLTIE